MWRVLRILMKLVPVKFVPSLVSNARLVTLLLMVLPTIQWCVGHLTLIRIIEPVHFSDLDVRTGSRHFPSHQTRRQRNSQLFPCAQPFPEGRPNVPGPHRPRKQRGTQFVFVIPNTA
jgi:hypothetical protein